MRPTPVIYAGVVALLSAGGASIPAADRENEEWKIKAWETYRPGVVGLAGSGENLSGGATGFLTKIDDREMIITCAHALSGVKWMSAKFDKQEPIACKLIAQSEEFDLAALELVDQQGKPKPAPGKPLILFAKDKDPKTASEIVLFGHPGMLTKAIHGGIISADPITLGLLMEKVKIATKHPKTRVYPLDITSTQGMSGGPVLTRTGEVVGIQQLGWQPELSGINFCIPHSYIYNLDLKAKATEFPGGFAPYSPNDQAAFIGLIDPAKVPKADKELVEVSCRQWGAFPKDPTLKDPAVADFIFNQLVGSTNKERFQRVVPKAELQEILKRNRLVHLVNPTFRFGFLAPDSYQIKEEIISQKPLGLQIILTNTNKNIPAPYNRLTIRAEFIDDVPREKLAERMIEMSQKFPVDVLKLRIHPPPPQQPPGVPPIPPPPWGLRQPPFYAIPGFFQKETDVLRTHGGPLADVPTLHPTEAVARYLVAYDSFAPARNTHVVHYAIAGNVAITTDFVYLTFPPGKDQLPDIVERRFIAETIALGRPVAPPPKK